MLLFPLPFIYVEMVFGIVLLTYFKISYCVEMLEIQSNSIGNYKIYCRGYLKFEYDIGRKYFIRVLLTLSVTIILGGVMI